jgi:hypothetical protein
MIKQILGLFWAELGIMLAYLVYTGFVNFTLISGSNLNTGLSAHDEYVAVNEVYNILHPYSLKHLFMSLTTGSIQFYGREVFYLDAIVAWLPEKIWGLEGMVVSIRLFHALLMAFALFLLVKTFVKQRFFRLFLIFTLLFSHYTIYFGIIPKPEPHQFFFLALFLYYFVKREYSAGWYFVFLGLAYGIKFNILVLLPGFFVILIMKHGLIWRKLFMSIGYLVIGFLFANPFIILGLVKTEFLMAYLNNTFFFVKNIDDVASVSFKDWFYQVWIVYFNSGLYLAVFGLAIALFFLIRTIIHDRVLSLFNPGVILLTMGLALLFPVMLWSKRLYPHYLWPGYIFFMMGLFVLIENSNFKKYLKKSFIVLLSFSVLNYSFKSLPSLIADRLAAKTTSEKQNECISKLFVNEENPIVLQDIAVYYPFEHLVNNYRHHPFSGNPPYEISGRKIFWHSGMTVNYVNELKPNWLILSKRFKESKYYSMKECIFQSPDFSTLYERVNNQCPDLIFYKKRIK